MPESESDRYEEFLRYFSQDRDRLLRYIESMLPNHADAEDVFQRCSILLWRKFDNFDQELEFLPWACGVAFYEVRNFLRVSGRDRLQFDDELIRQLAEQRKASLMNIDERMAALETCLQNVKSADRDLIQSAYGQSGSLVKLAEASGRAVQTLYNRLTLVRRSLLECVHQRLNSEKGRAL